MHWRELKGGYLTVSATLDSPSMVCFYPFLGLCYKDVIFFWPDVTYVSNHLQGLVSRIVAYSTSYVRYHLECDKSFVALTYLTILP